MKNLYKILTALLMMVAVVLTAQTALGDSSLKITDVSLNGESIASKTITLYPLNPEYKFDITLNNNLTQKITTLKAWIEDGTGVPVTPATLPDALIAPSIPTGTSPIPFKFHLPDLNVGDNQLFTLKVEGDDFYLNKVSDSFQFKVNVTYNPGNPTVFFKEVKASTQPTNCYDLSLKIDLVNVGQKSENDVFFRTFQNGKEVYATGKYTVDPGTRTFEFTLPKKDLSNGPLSISLYYRSETYSDSKDNVATVTLDNCISNFEPKVDDSLTLVEGKSQPFEINVKDDKITQTIKWELNGQTVATGVKSYTFSDSVIKEHTLKVTAGPDSKTWKINVILTPPPTSASLQVSSLATISIAQSDLGKTITKTVTLSNPGTLGAVTGLTYSSTATTLTVTGLKDIPAQGSIDATLSIAVPSSLASGESTLGTLTFKANNNLSATLPVKVDYTSLLKITDVELNGDTDGEFAFDETNTFKVTVENDYTNDLEDVTVTITIRDVDDDDLDEESESFDLDQGDDDTISVTFDLSSEELTEEDYTVDITVEGRDVDDHSIKQTASETQTFSVSRDSHQVILKNVDLSSTILQCLKQTDLRVEVENVGKSNEDTVEIKVKNTALGIDLSRKEINLDKYSGSDSKYETAFSLETENAKAGTYALSVEVYVDGSLEDSASVNLEVRDCGSVTSGSGTYNTEVLATQLQKQLQTSLEAKAASSQQNVVPVTASGFRDTNTYLMLLVGLTVLLVLGIVLGLATFGKRK
ncbi:MAG: hypothetical protein AABX04_02485 [Nanoarchaeota archaeon]